MHKKNLQWSLIEILIPREIRKSPKAMEQVLDQIYSLRNTPENIVEKYWQGEVTYWFSLEIVHFSDETHFYIRTPAKYKNIIEANIYANYKDVEIVEVEDKTDNVIFDGPVLEILRQEDCFMLGNYDDIQKAPFFAHRTWMSESQLRRLAGDGFFDKQAVNKILEQNKVKDEKAGSKSRTGIIPENSYVSEEKDIQEGVVTVTSLANKPEFEIFETYMTYDMDEDGFDEEIIVWVEGKTREIVRHTDLDRVCSDGKRPFFKGDLIKRPGRSYSIGLAELLYPLNTELDAIHNQQIDFGTITTIPFFIYTPMSGLKQEEIRLEPGVGIPVDDVNSFRFPQFPQNLNFHQSQEEDIRRMANDLTALQGPSIGQAPSPLGAGRTATGLTTILQESNLQLDIFIKRLQSTYAKLLKSLDVMIQSRIPDGITIRVLGADGIQVKNETGENEFKTIKTRFELNGNVDYELLANSASLNRELDFQKAMLRNQVLVNPLDLQIGLQNIETIYENRKDWLKKQGEIDPDKFLVKPKMIEKPMTPEEEVAFIVQGKKPRLTLNDDHRLKIDVLSAFANSPEFKKGIEFGNIHKDAQVIMRDVIKEHTGLMESASAQAQTSNVTGLQIAPSLSARVAGTMDQKEGIAQGMVGVNQETPAGPAPGGA